MAAPKRQSNFLQFLLIFAIVYLGSQFVLRQFFPQPQNGGGTRPAVELTAANVRAGNNPVLTLRNNTAASVSVPLTCPLPPVDVFRVAGGGSGAFVPLTPTTENANPQLQERASQTAIPCAMYEVSLTKVAPPQGSVQIDLSPWKYSLFGEFGTYEVRLHLPAETVQALQKAQTGSTVPATLTARFRVTEPEVFTKIFRTFITAPFFNFLIFAGSWLPDHNLGLAIILLTLAVKFLLFLPTQHALEGQRKMQMLQPKLDELKKQYGKDPQRMQSETMKLWKEHKVNPFQSCLPTLIQFPILIGLFYVVRDGSVLGLSRHLIYPFYQNLTWSFGTSFLGLDLLKPNLYVLPPLLVLFQFLQMKLTFAIADRKKNSSALLRAGKEQKIIEVKKDGAAKEPLSQTELQQRMFLYALPLMIGFFALKFPAAVSIYWGVSTLFAIGQQMIVNREHLSVR